PLCSVRMNTAQPSAISTLSLPDALPIFGVDHVTHGLLEIGDQREVVLRLLGTVGVRTELPVVGGTRLGGVLRTRHRVVDRGVVCGTHLLSHLSLLTRDRSVDRGHPCRPSTPVNRIVLAPGTGRRRRGPRRRPEVPRPLLPGRGTRSCDGTRRRPRSTRRPGGP